MTSENHTAPLSFPLQLATQQLEPNSIVIRSDLAEGTLAMLGSDSAVVVTIKSEADYAAAAEELSKIKAVSKKIDEDRKALTKPLDDEKARVMTFVRPFTTKLEQVEQALKTALLDYQKEQQRLQQLAEAEAAERNRKASEALDRRAEKADASGKSEKADALREQAQAQVFAAPAPVASTAPKVAGLSTRKTYSAEVVNLQELATAAVARSLVEFAAGDAGKLLAHLTTLAFKAVPLKAITQDTKFLGQQATAMKESLDYPGVKLVTKDSIASSAKKG